LRNIARCNLNMLLERGHLTKVLPFITSPDRGLLTQLVALLSNQADGLDTGYACLAVANWAMQAEVKDTSKGQEEAKQQGPLPEMRVVRLCRTLAAKP
ncbi:hypothetical protein HaLaN_24454, partial [Haematococcus lacustris]